MVTFELNAIKPYHHKLYYGSSFSGLSFKACK